MDAFRSLGVASLLAQTGADANACRRQADRLCRMMPACASAGALARLILDEADALAEPGGADVLSLPLRTVAACFSIACVATGTPRQSPMTRPALSYRALQRARTTLDDFTTFYLPLHGLPPSAFFQHLPLLIFTEAAIYQLDEDNEDFVAGAISASAGLSCADGARIDPAPQHEDFVSLVSGSSAPAVPSSPDAPRIDPAPPSATAETVPRSGAPASFRFGVGSTLLGVLADEGLLSPAVLRELRDGEEYWALERRLCGQMERGQPLNPVEVVRASRLKSFDYRWVFEPMYCGAVHCGGEEY
jgi:hypothetical protein